MEFQAIGVLISFVVRAPIFDYYHELIIFMACFNFQKLIDEYGMSIFNVLTLI